MRQLSPWSSHKALKNSTFRYFPQFLFLFDCFFYIHKNHMLDTSIGGALNINIYTH